MTRCKRSLFSSVSIHFATHLPLSSKMHLIAAAIALASTSSALSMPSATSCRTQSQPNPIVHQYPDQITGTVNGSVFVLPIPYRVARRAIPSTYPILTQQYEKWLPNLGRGMYPAMLNALLDHDIQQASMGAHVPDFSVSESPLPSLELLPTIQRAVFQFPFVDRLNDGYTAMTYTSHILISNISVAIQGSEAYDYSVTPSLFNPPCDGYRLHAKGSTSFAAFPTLGGHGAKTMQSPLEKGDQNPYSLDL